MLQTELEPQFLKWSGCQTYWHFRIGLLKSSVSNGCFKIQNTCSYAKHGETRGSDGMPP